ncbi:MAG TPA: plasmid pRiA4b ORF-3 family protein [Gemmataceae bacterium]|jgi:hypothetical protein|nr:plasmid pRiA4b ORF-3 family protein [Gemmataceae bacterium]
MAKKKSNNVYELKVKLKYRKKIWRLIAIGGDQTLADLHNAIFEAFDRYDDHLYSFYVLAPGAKGRRRREGAIEFTDPFNNEEVGSSYDSVFNAEETTIDELNLEKGQLLKYLFDFGDEWEHEISVVRIEELTDKRKYPIILKKEGDSPPQYPDCDDEYDDEEDESD